MKPVWVMKSDPMSKIKEKKSKEKKKSKNTEKERGKGKPLLLGDNNNRQISFA